MDRRDFLLAAASVPFALRNDARRARRSPLALVTCDTQSRIAAVDPFTGRTVEFISVPVAPNSIELVGGNAAVVCHTNVGAVTVIDGTTLGVRHVLEGFGEPRYTAAHPDGRHAFVTDSGSEEVVSLDLVTGRVVGRARLGEWPRHVTIDATGSTLWVGLGNDSEHIAIVDVSDPTRPRLGRKLKPPFLVHDVGFLPGDRRLWVTAGQSGAMALYDRTGQVQVRLPADLAPQHVTFGNGFAYVTSGYSGTFAVHRPSDGRLLRTTRVPLGSFNVQAGFGLVLTPSLNRGTLCVLDRNGALLREANVAPSCHDACFVS